MRTGVRSALLVLVVMSIIGCDRVTKHMAKALLADQPPHSFLADSVRLTYEENAGGFLGLGATLPPAVRTAIFIVATGFLLVALVVAVRRSAGSLWAASGFALIFAGGVSNWIDRVLRGSVVDFMNLGIGWLRTGIFNVADVAIMLGAALLLASEMSARVAPDDALERSER